MQISKIAEIYGIKNVVSGKDAEIKWLLTDSRNLSFPDESLFFAIHTRRNDGHNYIPELYGRGLRYFVVSEKRDEYSELKEAVFLFVNNTVDALQKLAAFHRNSFSIPVIGITGSNGKTIVKEWLYQLLHSRYIVTRSPRSFNSQIGVPLSVWSLGKESQIGIFEAGISMPEEMQKLEKVIRPTIGIFTNLGDAHQENFVSLKQKCEEKLQLFNNSEVLIYDSDDKLVDITVLQMNFSAQLFTWGKNKNAKLQLLEKQIQKGKTLIKLKYNTETFDIEIPFTDDASFRNVMNCVSLMLVLDYTTTEIIELISRIEPVAMRLEVKDGVGNCLIINDSYNSDLNSLSIALDFLHQQAEAKKLSKTVILSDILQSGQRPEDLYSVVAKLLKSKSVDKCICIGTDLTACETLFKGINSIFYKTTDAFLKNLSGLDFQDEAILLKGSRTFRFEDISSRLERMTHETTLEINLNALVDNLNYFRAKLKPETKVMCMVKAYAYGSGSVEIARTLQHNRCDYLAVAVADEGAELRREGIRIPVVVMNPEKGSFGVLFDNNLEPEIYSFRLLESFINAAGKLGITDYPVHIKIDSGMHRLGFQENEMEKLVNLLKNQKQVKVRSVFSHLAGADEAVFDDFTLKQIKTFTVCADILTASFGHSIMRHVLNSAGTERFAEYQFDMVRIGIGLYGVSVVDESKLRQVSALKTIILQIKEIKAVETVGYSRKGKVSKDKTIAILPVGYADGYDRKLGNGTGEVFIAGKRAKIIGNVSMDLITVDITGIDAKEGDPVEIFGDNIRISEIASKLETIPYEILTGVSRRVKRIYYQE